MATIYHQYTIDAAIENVFYCVSDAQAYEKWWPLTCTGTPKLDEAYNFNFGPVYDWYAKVSTINAPYTIQFTMTKADEDWLNTSFGFELTDMGNKVKVNFYHKDWSEENDHFKIASFCWATLLNGLKQYLEKGIVVPFEQRA